MYFTSMSITYIQTNLQFWFKPEKSEFKDCNLLVIYAIKEININELII